MSGLHHAGGYGRGAADEPAADREASRDDSGDDAMNDGLNTAHRSPPLMTRAVAAVEVGSSSGGVRV